MSLSCLAEICCASDVNSCWTAHCDDSVRVDSTIAAIAIVENATLPEIGDTIVLPITGNRVITACNYADSLLFWIKGRQQTCAQDGTYTHFFHNGMLAKGTRAKPVTRLSENGSNYFAKKYLGYDTTIEIMLEEHLLPNMDVLCGMQKRAASLSVVLFFKQGVMVLDSDNDYNVFIQEAGFEITGVKNDFIMGSITLGESGLCQPVFHYAEDPKFFIQALKSKATFDFGTPVTTGLVELACGSKGGCRAYSIAPSIPFTYTPTSPDLIGCGNFELFQTCSDAVTAPVVINSTTGVIEAIAGLAVGEYKFTIKLSNDCCVQGTSCINISVK